MKSIIMLVMVVWSISLIAQNELRLILANQSMNANEFSFDLLAQIPETASEGVYLHESDLYFHLETTQAADLTAEVVDLDAQQSLRHYPAQVNVSLASACSDLMSLEITDDHLMINLKGLAFTSTQALEESGLKIEAGAGMYLLGSFVITRTEGSAPIQLRWDDQRPQALMSQVFEMDPYDLMVYPVDFNHLMLMEANFDDNGKVFAEASYSPIQNQNIGDATISGRSLETQNLEWSVYPNPTADRITLQVANFSNSSELWIIDSRGVKLGQHLVNSAQEQLFLSDYTFQPGYYSLVWVDDNQRVETKTVYYQPN
jgi:hypothetical protein